MHGHINFVAILLGGFASMIIGMIYYSDKLFGQEWKKLAKIDTKRFEKDMPRVMPLVFLGALITSYAVAYVTFLYHSYFVISWLGAGFVSSLIVWIVAAASIYIHNSLDQKAYKLTVISVANRLLSIVAMGLIIGWLHH